MNIWNHASSKKKIENNYRKLHTLLLLICYHKFLLKSDKKWPQYIFLGENYDFLMKYIVKKKSVTHAFKHLAVVL